MAFQVEAGKGSQNHLRAVAFQVEAGEGSQNHLEAVAFQVEVGEGSQGRQLHRCSPLRPSLVVVRDKMRESCRIVNEQLHYV